MLDKRRPGEAGHNRRPDYSPDHLVKPIPQLLAAYDDSLGVTAAFNLNLLARINRELEADFDLSRFHHAARYDEQERRIEMHLRSTCDQTVQVRKAGLDRK